MPVELFASSTQAPCWVEALRCGWLLECVQVLTVDCVVLHQLAGVPSGEGQLAAAWQILRVSRTRWVCCSGCCFWVCRGFSHWPLACCCAGRHSIPSHCTSVTSARRPWRVCRKMPWHPPHTAVLFCIECSFACAGGGARACVQTCVFCEAWCLARQSVYILCLVFGLVMGG